MAQSEDGTVVAITHQTDTKTSLLSTGLPPNGQPCGTGSAACINPALQFVLDGLPQGGIGIAAVPHDPQAFPHCGDGSNPAECPPRPAFLETNRTSAEVDLLRFYSDQGYTSSSLFRPFLVRETSYPLTANASGVDSRGIATDPSPRIRCRDALMKSGATPTPDALEACARLPARIFIANRSPESLLVGEIGQPTMNGDVLGYNPDQLQVFKNVPLTVGPSNVYVAPIVDKNGNFSLRVFIVCFDSASIIIYNPDADLVENVIRVGVGPYSMAFDPYDPTAAAVGAPVSSDPNVFDPSTGTQIKAYRFAYIASFTNSYVQVMDLDGSLPDKSTFEKVVFTLGAPTQPKGTQ
jgi:hypothetical protein